MGSRNSAYEALAQQSHAGMATPQGGSLLDKLAPQVTNPSAPKWTDQELEAEFQDSADAKLVDQANRYGTMLANKTAEVRDGLNLKDGGTKVHVKLEQIRAELKRRERSKLWLQKVRAALLPVCSPRITFPQQDVHPMHAHAGQGEPAGGRAGSGGRSRGQRCGHCHVCRTARCWRRAGACERQRAGAWAQWPQSCHAGAERKTRPPATISDTGR